MFPDQPENYVVGREFSLVWDLLALNIKHLACCTRLQQLNNAIYIRKYFHTFTLLASISSAFVTCDKIRQDQNRASVLRSAEQKKCKSDTRGKKRQQNVWLKVMQTVI